MELWFWVLLLWVSCSASMAKGPMIQVLDGAALFCRQLFWGAFLQSIYLALKLKKKNGWMSTKAGNQISLSHSLSFTHSRHTEQLLFSCLCSKVTLTLSHSHTILLSQCLTLSLFHSLIHSPHAEQLLFSCLCSKVTLTLSHSLILTPSHSHTLSISH